MYVHTGVLYVRVYLHRRIYTCMYRRIYICIYKLAGGVFTNVFTLLSPPGGFATK